MKQFRADGQSSGRNLLRGRFKSVQPRKLLQSKDTSYWALLRGRALTQAAGVIRLHNLTTETIAVPKISRVKRAPAQKTLATADKILDAALEEFAMLGFEGARMTTIASRAGTTHPLIHHHFGSKEALWEASVQHAFVPLIKAYQESVQELRDATPLDVVRIMTRRFILFSARYPNVGRIVSRESMIGGPRFAWLAKTLIGPLHQSIGMALKVAVKNGDLKSLPEASVVQALIGSVVQFYSAGPLVKALYGIDPLEPGNVQMHADAVIEIFFHGMRLRHDYVEPPFTDPT